MTKQLSEYQKQFYTGVNMDVQISIDSRLIIGLQLSESRSNQITSVQRCTNLAACLLKYSVY